MKNCAKGVRWIETNVERLIVFQFFKVEDFVHLLNERCSKVDHKLPTTTSIVNASNSKIEKQSNKITLAIALKILAEARRRCWIFIEEHNFKEAARYELVLIKIQKFFIILWIADNIYLHNIRQHHFYRVGRMNLWMVNLGILSLLRLDFGSRHVQWKILFWKKLDCIWNVVMLMFQ